MRILKKDPNKVKVKTETDNYEEGFDLKLTQKDKVNVKMDRILNEYNSVEAFAVKAKEPK